MKKKLKVILFLIFIIISILALAVKQDIPYSSNDAFVAEWQYSTTFKIDH